MPSAKARELTERQRAVIERIDRRMPIKVIARELGVSDTRINQHIRALKNIYSAENLGELVERFREENPDLQNVEKSYENEILTEESKGFGNSQYSKSQVPEHALIVEGLDGDDPGKLVMSDAMPLEDQAPWLRPGEPRVVPRVLDGEHAVWFRLAAILGIAFAILAAVVLAITAAVTISEALDGRAVIPVDENGLT